MNGGSDSNGTALYTSVNGGWDQITREFTPTDGTNPVAAGVRSGQTMSVYLDGATTPAFIQVVLAVENIPNGKITGSVNFTNGATSPNTLGTGRSCKVGGAWKGPNGTNQWPWATVGNNGALTGNPSLGGVRVNFRNNGLYSITAACQGGGGTNVIYQGYSNIPGDGGKANLDGGTNDISLIATSGTASVYKDFIFSNNGTIGNNPLVNISSGSALFWGCIFHDSRGTGSNATGTYYECEFYNINLSATNGLACITAASTSLPICAINCYFHDCMAANTIGILSNTGGSVPSVFALNSIFDTLASHGIYMGLSQQYTIIGCDFYNCGGSGIKNAMPNVAAWALILNSNFIANQQFGIDTFVDSSHGGHLLLMCNNKFGTGTMRNRSGNINPLSFGAGVGQGTTMQDVLTLASIVEVASDIYDDSTSPYNTPTTGDFSLVLAKAISKGRGFFTQTGLGKNGTRGYPDIGAAQAPTGLQILGGGGGLVDSQILPYGYVGYPYYWKWGFTDDVVVTLQSGSLPSGLSLIQSNARLISIFGVPTTVGTYSFVLRSTVGTSFTDAPFQITIQQDPDEGVGGMILG